MKTFQKVVQTAVLTAVASGLATAGQVNYLSNQVGPSATEVNYTLTLPKFDPALGTLLSVTLYFRASETSSVFTLTNNSPSAQTFDVAASANLVRNSNNSATTADKFTGETIQTFDTGIGSASGNCGGNPSSTVAPNNGCTSITLAGAGSATYGPFTDNNTDANYGFTTGTGGAGLFGVKKSGTSIANYVGAASTFTLTGQTLNSITLSGDGGNISVLQATNGTFRAEVDYLFTDPPPPVTTGTPEPATMGLLGSALIGLGLLRKKLVK